MLDGYEVRMIVVVWAEQSHFACTMSRFTEITDDLLTVWEPLECSIRSEKWFVTGVTSLHRPVRCGLGFNCE